MSALPKARISEHLAVVSAQAGYTDALAREKVIYAVPPKSPRGRAQCGLSGGPQPAYLTHRWAWGLVSKLCWGGGPGARGGIGI